MSIFGLPFVGKRLASKEKLKLFEPGNQNEAFDEYSTSARTAKKVKSGVNAMTDYTKNRLHSLNGFAALEAAPKKPASDEKPEDKKSNKKSPALIAPDGESLAKKLKAVDREEIDKLFEETLALSDGMLEARDNFDRDVKALNKLIADSKAKDAKPLNLSAVAGVLQEIREETEKAIKEQHKLEKQQTLDLFKDPSSSLNSIKGVVGLKTPEDVTQFKDDMVKELEKSQKAELSKFGKTMSDEVIKLHRLAQSERDRIALLDIFYKQSKFNQAQINKAAEEYRQKNGLPEEDTTVQIGYNPKEGKGTFKGIKPSDLQMIQTITGRKMQYDKSSNSFSMTLPKFGLLYYNRPNQQIDYDFTTMAAAVRACGSDTIIMSINYDGDLKADHPNGEKHSAYAMELGRKQFEAAVKAGFNPKITPDPENPNDPTKATCDIVIKVNGKAVDIKTLFGHEGSRLQAAQDSYTKEQAQRAAYTKNPPNIKVETAKYREQVKEIREKTLAAEQAAIAPAVPAGGHGLVI
ncbi:MAG: hypothetical protein Q8M03_03950 [Legionella sp.]|nr:hypothetical protein [Legionella sp.]